MAMPPAMRNILTKNRVFLLENMYMSEEFLAYLTSDFTLTDSMKDEIMTGKTNKQEKIGKFLDILVRRGSKGFTSFLTALVETHQDHIAQRLNQKQAAQLIHQRNAKYEGSAENEGPYVDQPVSSSSEKPTVTPSVIRQSSKESSSSFVPNPGQGAHNSGSGFGLQPSNGNVNSQQTPSYPGNSTSIVVAPVPVVDPSLTEDLSTAVVELVSRLESIELTLEVSDGNVTHPHEGVHCVKNGLAIFIRHESIPTFPNYNDVEINTVVTSCILNQFFECLNFTVENEYECSAEVIRDALKHKKLESYDAFLLFFLGFGRTDGTVYDKDGQEKSITRDILPLFNANECPALRNKPKLFVFQLAQPAQPAEPADVVGDHVDANLNRLSNDDIWSDMTIFSTVTNVSPAMCKKYEGGEKQPSYNIMYRVLMEVLNRFCHQMSFQEMLSKVQVILTSQAMREKYEDATHTCSFFSTPNTKPLYLKPR